MDKIDTEIRFAGMAEERLRREDPHYRVWSFTDDDDVTALYLGRVDMNGEPVERYDRTRTILAFDGGRVFAKWHELLEAIPQDSRQLSCEELVPRLRKALGQAKTCGKLEQQIRDLEES